MRKHIQPHLYCAIFPKAAGCFFWLWARGALYHLPHLSKSDLEINFSDLWTIDWFFCFVSSYGRNTLGLFLIVLIYIDDVYVQVKIQISVDINAYTRIYMYASLLYEKEIQSQLEAALRSSGWGTFKSQKTAYKRAVWKCAVWANSHVLGSVRLGRRQSSAFGTWGPFRPQDGIICFEEHSWNLLYLRIFTIKGKHFTFFPYFLLENIR